MSCGVRVVRSESRRNQIGSNGMGGTRGAAFVVALGLTVTLGAPSVGAVVPAKGLKACSVLKKLDLEPIFDRPFRTGLADDSGGCSFRKPVLLKKDDIVVSVIPVQYGSVKRAKAAFAKKLSVTTELAGAPESVAVGNEAYYLVFIGTDLLTMRVGSVVVDVRIENNSDDKAVYHDQAIAVGQAIAVNVATAP